MRRRALLIALATLIAAGGSRAQAPASPASDDEFVRAVFFAKKYADLGDTASALDQLARAEALRSDDPVVLYDTAVVLARAGRYAESQAKADRYLQLFPDGEQKALIGRLQLELEFQRELQKKREDDQAWTQLLNRAASHYAAGEFDDALNLYVRAAEQRPRDPLPLFNQAVVLEKQGAYAEAIERFRTYAEVENDLEARGAAEARVLALEGELADMRSKILCSFCGRKLPSGATWCERCWHGPYRAMSAAWNGRSCVAGASATRAMYAGGESPDRIEPLQCHLPETTMADAVRYTPERQAAIRDARKAEGWTYSGDALRMWSDGRGGEILYAQGADHLERVTSSTGGEILTYAAHRGGEGVWLLDREDLVVDGQKYTNRYSFDESGRIARQEVQYQNVAGCNHLISMTADYAYRDGALASASIRGGYEGFPAEGSPRTEWQATVSVAFDDRDRVTSEELAVTSFTKVYDQRPNGALRDDVNRFYPSMRPRRPVENLERLGDVCATSGATLLSNPIDLRPFYAMLPNLAVALENGIRRAVVTFTYPEPTAP